jgi:hypothetical protein
VHDIGIGIGVVHNAYRRIPLSQGQCLRKPAVLAKTNDILLDIVKYLWLKLLSVFVLHFICNG